jgi:RNA 3'-terminal phosphate cyclase
MPAALLDSIKEVLNEPGLSVDEYHGDQLLIYAALADGKTKFTTTRELSMHF